ncbi:MFS transporter [Conexibacter sp. W3-3-2]|uniref:MFS transporter n=1 Tax=Conexibacter sp. W3-3-2 TaxID=2675227 RepID=UPI0012B7C1A8|nr:MFS transporter [Conexibacter sp. W3-3-2]MTD42891.1 MFS transporter [Conexibacter sp. W3-3-2]
MRTSSSPRAVLAVLCLAVFTINLATTITNIALPTLVAELDASTRDLLWIVDGYNLAFAALVLAMGSLSDRFGRRGALVAGLAVYLAANLASAWAGSPDVLVAFRVVAGIGAAMGFPTTLSIISNVFPDRRERARAIGLWGASTGISIALGPIVGGALLEQFWWGSTFVLCAGLAAVTIVLALALVPTSADPTTPRLDLVGLTLSTAGLGALVYTIIEAPERGWGSGTSLTGFAVAVAILAAFTWWERRTDDPMLDVRLFANLRFTAASGAVTFAFFALFGFIFLVTQYFQFILQYGVLEAGLRQIPVALAVAVTSVVGTALAVRLGAKAVVTTGLLLLAGGYVWISTVQSDTGYLAIALQMVMVGAGMGLTSAPATEAIMGVVPAAKAGIGSAVNDATRELGGTLGVAVIGSVALSFYRDALASSGLPDGIVSTAQESLGAAGAVARATGDATVLAVAQDGFLDGLQAGCLVAAGVAVVGAVLVARYLPAHPGQEDQQEPATPTVPAAA